MSYIDTYQRDQAERLLLHYFELALDGDDHDISADMRTEIRDIVDSIYTDIERQIQKTIEHANRQRENSRVEIMTLERKIDRLIGQISDLTFRVETLERE